MLAPTLTSGDIVIMDNLSSHKVAGVRQAPLKPSPAEWWSSASVARSSSEMLMLEVLDGCRGQHAAASPLRYVTPFLFQKQR